ncbi:phage Gp37/Gp68 family protein [Nonomuraea sp. NPDC048901]|uniref:DUF5131 family protein n=1 Tax=Nonomuraea sp. NPDC048901 TaxID=3155627 RepID=UPI0034045071
MADNTKIEWSDATWNVVIGCDRVSPGCGMPRFDGDDPGGCYAITQAHIRAANPHPKVAAAFAGLTERTEKGIDWTGKVNLLADRLDQPLRWRKPKRIFVNSLSDLFHERVPDEFIARVFAVMANAPQHTFQVLTKRHARMKSLLNKADFRLMCEAAEADLMNDEASPISGPRRRAWQRQWWSNFAKPLRNVWVGVSCEDQKWADIRIPALLDTPAAVRFISAEPLLGPIDLFGPLVHPGHRPRLTYWLDGRPGWGAEETTATGLTTQRLTVGPRLDWVIAGGESGPGARPAHPDWFRQLRDQCQQAGVAYLFKQWGGWAPTGLKGIGRSPKGHALVGDPVDEHGHRIEMARVGKKAAGRLLDGRTWDEFPTVTPQEVALHG